MDGWPKSSGTLKAITTTLFNHGFSILQAYHRTIEIGRSSKTDLLVRKPLAPGQLQLDNLLLSELQYIFSGEDLQREFGFKVDQQRLAEPPGVSGDE